MDTNEDQNKYKRKRKKSFLKNARKYGKKGCYGRGVQLDADTYQYVVKSMEAFREGFDSEENKKMFIENVFKRTEGEELNFSCNQVGSRFIETLLPFANDSVIQRFLDAFMTDLRPLCNDRFSSHVIEALFTEAYKRSFAKNVDEEQQESFKQFVLKVSKFLVNNLEDFVWETYVNHVIRSIFEKLLQIQKEPLKSQNKNIETDIPLEYSQLAIDFAERLLAWPQFRDLPYTELPSGLLQVLLKGLAKVDVKLLKKFINKLIDECFTFEQNEDTSSNKKNWPQIFYSKPALMVLETTLETASPKHYTQIYAKCFSGRIASLATTRNTNFVIQKLLLNCKEKVEFEAIFDELNDHFEEIINNGHSGVLFALSEGCKNLSSKQGGFIQNLMKSLHCSESEDKEKSFIICLCKLINYETLQNTKTTNLEKEKLNLHGTLILQNILEFNKPIKIINLILDMELGDLKGLFSNTMGSHIVDSFMKSKFIGEKSRERLIRKLQGSYQDLAGTKYGSRSFEAIWNVCGVKYKLNIIQELAQKDGLWSNSECGKIVANKIDLALFKRNKEEWKNSLNKVDKVNDLKNLTKLLKT
ncbi:nucleolar protein 9 [Onthophagus taurus]|uniref:nucleolar protein 9 n=1 Tax=Onthophagus taurus TaxID=166361 RepID=UPI0039BE204D